MQVNYFFPIAIGVESNFLSEEENDFLGRQILANNSNGRGQDEWLSGKNSPKNSFGDLDFCTKNESAVHFLKKATDFVRQYQKEVYKSDHDLQLASAWYNIYTGTNYQEKHHHLPHRLSAIYYVKSPVGSSPTIFDEPMLREEYPGVKEPNILTYNHVKFEPTERDLLIFPSYMIHFVPLGDNSEPRISMAINWS